MTRDDIIRMAREADDWADSVLYENPDTDWCVTRDERFANLVAAHTLSNIDPRTFMSCQEACEAERLAEREACAKVCEEQKLKYEARVARPEQFRTIHPETARIAAMTCDFNAAAIRERGSDA